MISPGLDSRAQKQKVHLQMFQMFFIFKAKIQWLLNYVLHFGHSYKGAIPISSLLWSLTSFLMVSRIPNSGFILDLVPQIRD